MIGSAEATSVLSEEELRQVAGGHSHGRGELLEQLTTRGEHGSEGSAPARMQECWLPEDDGRSCDDDDDDDCRKDSEACVPEENEEVLVICGPDPGIPEADPPAPDDRSSSEMDVPESALPAPNELGLPEMIDFGGGDDVVSASDGMTLPEQGEEDVFAPTTTSATPRADQPYMTLPEAAFSR